MVSPHRQVYVQAQLYGIGSALADGIQYWGYAISFAFGTYLVTLCPCNPAHLTIDQLIGAFFGVLIGASGAANANAFAPDVSKARKSARRIFALVDSKPKIHVDASKQQVCV